MSIIRELKDSFKNGSPLIKLIYINIGVFLLLHASIAVLYLAGLQEKVSSILVWFALPADLQRLALQPWTIITYMFLHKDLFHILFNIMWLYWFGKIFLSYFDGKRLLNLYLLGGFSGAVLYISSYNIFPVLREQSSNSMALGASAAVMAVVISIAAYVPNHKLYLLFFGPVKIIWLAIISFILSSIIDFSVNTGGKIAHIGGALFGYIFVIYYRKGKDITLWFSRFMDFLFISFRKKEKMKVTYRKPADDLEYNSRKIMKQKEIDRILDKISKSGYDSLTREEKELLFKMSK